MKDQYFADKRDFVKYELLLDLSEAVADRSLMSVVMLTPNDGSREGSVTRYKRGSRRRPLHKFLERCAQKNSRKVSLLRGFMARAKVEYLPVWDDVYDFAGNKRVSYFAVCARQARKQRLIFFDPDVGLQTGSAAYMRSNGTEKYLMYDELKEVARKAPRKTVFVIYQHLQRNKRRVLGDISRKCSELCGALDAPSAAFATDRDVAFLVTSRDPKTYRAAADIVVSQQRHKLEVGEVGRDGPSCDRSPAATDAPRTRVREGKQGNLVLRLRQEALRDTEEQEACRWCHVERTSERRLEPGTPRRCPECDLVFKGKGWGGIDAHWKAEHKDVLPYKELWAGISACKRHRR